jgi:hypothetical protein
MYMLLMVSRNLMGNVIPDKIWGVLAKIKVCNFWRPKDINYIEGSKSFALFFDIYFVKYKNSCRVHKQLFTRDLCNTMS